MRILKIGMAGADVKRVQQALNKVSKVKLTSDGWFGTLTETEVKVFQIQKGLLADGIVGYNTYNALGLLQQQAPKYCVWHCSATPERVAGFTAKRITDYHIITLGWGRPGYGRVWEYDGKMVETWKIDTSDGIQPFEMTYGTGNRQVDLQAINVCYVGGVNKQFRATDTRTPEQKESMAKFAHEMVEKHPDILHAGHNQFFNKGCPSFWTPTWLAEIGIPDKNIYKADPFGYGKLFATRKVL